LLAGELDAELEGDISYVSISSLKASINLIDCLLPSSDVYCLTPKLYTTKATAIALTR
jgi:hypothetical protein